MENNNSSSDSDEVLLKVPKDLALLPVGFAIDAGGSVTKLIYRSKEDYKDGKRISDVDSPDGVLRLRYVRSGGDEYLINFIKDRCDILASASEAEFWYNSGVQTQRFTKRLEEVLKIKIRGYSEPEANFKALSGFIPRLPDSRAFGLSPAAVDKGLEMCRAFVQMMKDSEEMGDRTFGDITSATDSQFLIEYVTKLMTTDAETWASELSQYEIEWPVLCFHAGSACAMMTLTEDGKYGVGGFTTVSGKTFLGLGKLLCGVEDFDELIELASRGDHRKVDTLTGDLKVRGRTEVDWYSLMPENIAVFTLGKVTDKAQEGKYSKEDVAASVLNLIIYSMAKYASCIARLTKVKSVVFAGSFLNHQLTRDLVQEHMLSDTLMFPLTGGEPLKMVFVPHPGFIGVFGVWYRNLELEQERRAVSNNK